jgi:hypothetical protein
MSHNQRLLEALRKIRDEGAEYRDFGICGNVSSKELDSALDSLMRDWPQAGGSFLFPVSGGPSYVYERDRGLLWVNPRRIELLNWMITSLEETLNVA